ncbi:hypothetical protein [Pediococcus pentosaceus]|uniref:hypothetical protein n=1 Tax=Pediococcus pentosaceus TaxID=1255 RepID=UPI003982B4E5
MSDKVGFSDFEKRALKERAEELRREQENKRSKKNPEADALELIARMSPESAYMASNIYDLVKEIAPQLHAKTWYGMPAYANADNKIVLFFQDKDKFESRYSTLGFEQYATLDDGDMWPTSFALATWNNDVEKQVRKLITKATQPQSK